jgi:hypothetical protein
VPETTPASDATEAQDQAPPSTSEQPASELSHLGEVIADTLGF